MKESESPDQFIFRWSGDIFTKIFLLINLIQMIYHILDIFFILFHSSLVIFNLFGWILQRTRIWNLFTLLFTGASWIILGLIVGTLGYCPLTEWHFNVLLRLGESNLPNSYIKYLTERITGLDVSASLVDKVTLYSFIAALTISLFLNIRDFRIKKKIKNIKTIPD